MDLYKEHALTFVNLVYFYVKNCTFIFKLLIKPQGHMDYNITKLPLFQSCGSDFFRTIESQSQNLLLEKNQILFLQEEKASRFFFIKSGWIKLFRETLDGTQAVIDILSAGHIFAENSIFNDNAYPYSAEAAEHSEVISIPVSLLKTQLETNPKFALGMLCEMAQQKRGKDQELEHRTIQNAPQRIGCFLLRLINQNTQSPLTIHLPYDKTLIAARLGMQPETFSRGLMKLKAETGMEIKGATVALKSIQQLSDYACAACSSEFPCKDLKSKTCQQQWL